MDDQLHSLLHRLPLHPRLPLSDPPSAHGAGGSRFSGYGFRQHIRPAPGRVAFGPSAPDLAHEGRAGGTCASLFQPCPADPLRSALLALLHLFLSQCRDRSDFRKQRRCLLEFRHHHGRTGQGLQQDPYRHQHRLGRRSRAGSISGFTALRLALLHDLGHLFRF